MAKILLVAYDTAPAKALSQLADELRNRGNEITPFLLDAGKVAAPSDLAIREGIVSADIVLCGISSQKNSAVEMAAAFYAMSGKKPLGIYADTFDRWRAQHLVEVLPLASFLFVVNEEEAQRAREMYPGLRVEAVGNPEWYKYFLPADREASRALVGAKDYECVVLVPFTKNPQVNTDKITATLQATNKELDVGESFRYCGPIRVVINTHPGDKTPRDFYQEAVQKSGGFNRTTTLLFSDNKADELIPGADVVVGPSTSAAIHAMARGIPLVDVSTEAIQSWLKEETGKEHTYFAQHGGSLEVAQERVGELTGLLVYLTETFEDPVVHQRWRTFLDKQIEAQAALVPPSSQGASIERMADVLLSMRAPASA